MNVNKSASRRSLTSNFKQVDAHNIAPHEYEELPEFTEDMLARAKLKKGGVPCHPIRANLSPYACPRKS